MKKILSVDVFKVFIEKISIVKKCKLKNNNEAVIELNNGNKGIVFLAIADEGYPKQVMDIIANTDSNLYRVIIAPYISEQTSCICKDAGVGYMDLAGNCFISFDCFYIDIKGNKNENVSKRGLKSIYERSSVVSSVILRIMLEDVNKVWKMKDLAEAAGCSIGQVAKVKEFLLKQTYIEKTSNGIRIVEPSALMSDWAKVYDNNSEEKISCYSLDSVSTLEAKLAKMKTDIGVESILTGFSGGSRYQPVVRYQKVHAYIDYMNIEKAIDYLGLKKVETGANVILMLAYNDCVKQGAKLQKGNMVASPVQLYLDCMSIKGRGEEMAEAILEREICK
ncbi:MAG: hypothetical protein K6B68_05910 [Eubacterium sp.]|nr:hypothetical protein [Eubacterium sp.]